MNGKQAKKLRALARAAGLPYKPTGYDAVNVRQKAHFSDTKVDSKGRPLLLRYYTTYTAVRRHCGKSLVQALKQNARSLKVMLGAV